MFVRQMFVSAKVRMEIVRRQMFERKCSLHKCSQAQNFVWKQFVRAKVRMERVRGQMFLGKCPLHKCSYAQKFAYRKYVRKISYGKSS